MSVESSIGLNDGMSPVFKQIYDTMRPVLQAMENLQQMLGLQVEPEFVTEARNRVEDLNNMIKAVDPEVEVSANTEGLDDAKDAIQTINEQLENITNIPPPNIDGVVGSVEGTTQAFAGLEEQIAQATDPARAEHLRESLERLKTEMGQTEVPPIQVPIEPNVPTENPVEQMNWNPVEIPVLFQTEGFERLQEESNDVIQRLNNVMDSQREISRTAQGMELLSPTATEDINNLLLRIRDVREEMTNFDVAMTDAMDTAQVEQLTAQYERMRSELAQVSDLQENFNQAMASGDATHILSTFDQLNNSVNGVERNIRDTIRQQQNFNKEVNNGNGFFRDMIGNVGNLGTALKGLAIFGVLRQAGQWFQTNVLISDQYNTLRAQIDFMNDGMQTSVELQDLIFASAKRTRATFMETAEAMVRMHGTVGEMFADNRSLIQFVETFQQATIASGANARDMEVAMSAMERAMADGALAGRDFDFIMQRSSRTIQAIAEYLEVPMYQVRNLANEGLITADVLASAMFNAVEDINNEFNSMDDTWEDHMNNMRNMSLRAFEPLMERWSAFIQGGGGFEIFMNAWINVIQVVAVALLGLFNLIAWVIEAVAPVVEWFSNLIMNNLDWIMMGLIALGIALLIMGAKWLFAEGAAQIATSKMFIGLMKVLIPLMKILIPIILFIYLMDMLGFTVADVLGFVAGIFGAVFAFLFNLFAYFWNVIASVAEFLVNVWNHPVYATQRLFFNLVSNVLNLFGSFADGAASAANTLGDVFVSGANIAIRAVNGLIGLLNKIPGIDIGTVGEVSSASVLDGVGDRIRGLASGLDPGATPEGYWEAPRLGMADMGSWAGAASNWTRDTVGGLTDRFNGLFDTGLGDLAGGMGDVAGLDQDFLDKLGSIEHGIDGANDRLGNGLGRGNEIGDIGRIKDDVEISEEDLKLLKDIAERNFILNYRQLTPELHITVNGADYDEEELAEHVLELIEDMIDEQSASSLVTT